MTTEQKIIRTKVGVLELAKQLGNVSKACRLIGNRAIVSIDLKNPTRPTARPRFKRLRGRSRSSRIGWRPRWNRPSCRSLLSNPRGE